VRVPFGASSGQLTAHRGRSKSMGANFTLRTSASGFVQNTMRQGLSNVTVSVRGTNISTKTNQDGAFVLADVPASPQVVIEINPETSNPIFKGQSQAFKKRIEAGRDNQIVFVEIQGGDATGSSFALSAAPPSSEQALTAPVKFA